ncbi:gasdermin-E [Sceloporus undulatus]|uniref:gasdermin-E n=1 Tax=Sceloporus undulatus TaxID=8520 RepID=UPI001C4C09CC|nr:gasdermin-E [Sceloporus undulatus]
MFAKATKNFVKEVDSGGDLIPVPNLNNLDKLQFLSLVTKKKKMWCWQKPKYHILSVTLNDVLAKGEPIEPVVAESDFVKYEGKFEDYVTGSIDTSFGRINLGAGGKGIVKSQSSFGNLKKQEADLQKLMTDVRGRAINLQHTLLQQMLERKHEVLCILTERIITTQKCLISEHVQTEEKIASMVGISTKIIKVSVSENENMIKDSNVILEIPAPTAIAYGVIELYIKRDGQFEFCLLHEHQGGFERESTEGPSYRLVDFRDTLYPHLLDAVDNEKQSDSPIPSDASVSILNKDVLHIKTKFQPFANLSEDKQEALYRVLCELLLHEEVVIQLEDVLDNVYSEGNTELVVVKNIKPLEEPTVEEFLQLIGIDLPKKDLMQKVPSHQNKELLLAAHILLSAMAELSDYALVLLRACCDLQVLPTLCCLPDMTSRDGTVTLKDPMMAPLADTGRFWLVQRLFALSNINLEMTESSIRAVTTKKPRFLPIILYIALYGLCALACKTHS